MLGTSLWNGQIADRMGLAPAPSVAEWYLVFFEDTAAESNRLQTAMH